MNSSTGFNKRNLLRPASGLLSSKREFLKVVDISKSTPIFVALIRTEVAAIQEQINLLDKDKSLRSGDNSLAKSCNLNISKWVKEAQNMVETEQNDAKIFQQMGVDNYEAGFKKLWKLLTNLDLILSKITELQAIQFLKYDQHFQKISKHSSNGERILQSIGNCGFSPISCHLSQLLLDREIQLFQSTSDLKRTSQSSSGARFSKIKVESEDIIEQLKKENNQLQQLVQQMQGNHRRQIEMLRVRQSPQKEEIKQESTEHTILSSDPREALNQVEDKYKEQIEDLTKKIQQLNHENGELHIHCSMLEAKYKAAESQLKSQEFKPKEKPAAGSFEQALLQQMNKMKSGFERKIKVMLQEWADKEKAMRKREYECRAENDRIKWEKGLLMKKYEVLISS